MKKQMLSVTVTLLLAVVSARATLYTQTFNPGTAIPDGNPVGTADAESFTMDPSAGDAVGGLSVNLNLSGGYDGNLYAYLVSPNGTMVVLLNQPGVTPGTPFGNATSGMNITLADGGTAITASSVLSSGTYSAAGSLSGFNGSTADGTWTLFFADLTSGGGTSTLNSWSLDIEAVPEPVTTALVIFFSLVAMRLLAGHFLELRVFQKWKKQ